MQTNETKGKKVTASEVAITTATIEVKILQIGNRQFTLSVFDQLIEEPVIHPDTGKLCGTPWGWVNRHTDCKEISKHDVEHLHIIWQKGNELRKAVAAIPWQESHYCSRPNELPKTLACSYFRKQEDRSKLAALWLEARILAGERIDLGSADFGNHVVPFNINGHRFEATIDYQVLWAIRQSQEHWARRQLYDDLRNNVGTTKVQEVLALLVTEVEALAQLITTWEKSYKRLTQLDQLFIAV